MTEFSGVTVTKAANIYFDGNVTSRAIIFADGTHKTLGIMLPGEYEFATDAKEIMEILAGELEVMLPGGAGWQAFKAGSAFEVPGQSKFQVKIKTVTDYCCSYLTD